MKWLITYERFVNETDEKKERSEKTTDVFDADDTTALDTYYDLLDEARRDGWDGVLIHHLSGPHDD